MDVKDPAGFVPEFEQIPSKYKELWKKHNARPVPESLWNEVLDLARQEEATPEGKSGIFGKVSFDALEKLAQGVRAEGDPVKRYQLTSEKSPTGEIWFDVLIGLSSQTSQKAIEAHLKKGPPANLALDIGAGTGKAGERALPFVNKMVFLDKANFLLDIARSRLGLSPDYVQSDALLTPFNKDSFDLVLSQGLISSLTGSELNRFVEEVKRVLKPGGRYLDTFVYTEERIPYEARRGMANAKGILADMIVDAVSGQANLKAEERPDGDALIEAFIRQGMTPKFTPYHDEEVLVLEFTKQ